MFKNFKIKHKEKFSLAKIDPEYDEDLKSKDLLEKTAENIENIVMMQERLYAESKQSLLIILQALDAGGKDGTIRKVFGPINPQGCQVVSYKTPTALELSHDFLWRIHKESPQKGMIKIFNRSHYEDVLIVKVHDWISDDVCRARYDHINNFEKLLFDNQTKILKFFLYISKDEQKKRFQERLDIPEKNWKFAMGDLDERKFWDKYIDQFEEVFYHTSTDYAPWYVVPANNKKFRNYMISSIVLNSLEKMDPKYPKALENLDKIVIE